MKLEKRPLGRLYRRLDHRMRGRSNAAMRKTVDAVRDRAIQSR